MMKLYPPLHLILMFNNIVIDRYKHQPIIPTNFGKLALLQTQDRHATPQTILQKQWCMLRGQVDKITQVTHDKHADRYPEC